MMDRLDVGGCDDAIGSGGGDDRRQLGQSDDRGRHATGDLVNDRHRVVAETGCRRQGSHHEPVRVGRRARQDRDPNPNRLREPCVASDQREQPALAGQHDGGRMRLPQAGERE